MRGEPTGDGFAVRGREPSHIDHPGDPVGSSIDCSMHYSPAGGVPDQHYGTAGRVARVDGGNHRTDVIFESNTAPIGLLRFHSGQRDRMGLVSGLLENGNDLLPRGPVEPQSGDEDDVHTVQSSAVDVIATQPITHNCRSAASGGSIGPRTRSLW